MEKKGDHFFKYLGHTESNTNILLTLVSLILLAALSGASGLLMRSGMPVDMFDFENPLLMIVYVSAALLTLTLIAHAVKNMVAPETCIEYNVILDKKEYEDKIGSKAEEDLTENHLLSHFDFKPNTCMVRIFSNEGYRQYMSESLV
ncbi:MAG: hypothetical protein ACTJLM_02180 [Ehrlichia sp.]